METKLKEINVRELEENEELEIEGGTQRKDQKQTNFFEAILTYFKL